MSNIEPSNPQELANLGVDASITWTILSTATEGDIDGIIAQYHLNAIAGATLRNIALRHPNRTANTGKFVFYKYYIPIVLYFYFLHFFYYLL